MKCKIKGRNWGCGYTLKTGRACRYVSCVLRTDSVSAESVDGEGEGSSSALSVLACGGGAQEEITAVEAESHVYHC